MAGLPTEDVHKIVRGNAIKLFELPDTIPAAMVSAVPESAQQLGAR